MNYMMIDTAEGTRALLFANGAYYYDENLKNAGSETLLPMLDGLLNKAGIKLADVDVFGACIGPGSFTGLRVGLTTVNTFCYALDKPCFGVNNLRLNSYNNMSAKVISVADAGSKVCYIAGYDGDAEILPDKCVTLDDARRIIAEHANFGVSTDNKLAGVIDGTAGVGERELRIAAEKNSDRSAWQKRLLPLYVRKAQPERGAGDL